MGLAESAEISALGYFPLCRFLFSALAFRHYRHENMIELELVDMIWLVSDDAVGPTSKSIFIKLRNGKLIEYTNKKILKFIKSIPPGHTKLYQLIERSISYNDNPKNYEIVLFDRET